MKGDKMVNLNVNASLSPQYVNPQFKAKEKALPAVIENKKGVSTGTKWAIGLGLTALAATGLYLVTKKPLQAKKFAKLFKEDKALIDNAPKVEFPHKGKTIEESIRNFFGKETDIAPHTYDVTKEYPIFTVQRNQGGFTDLWITPNGFIDRRISSREYKLPDMVVQANTHGVANNRVSSSSGKVLDPRAVVSVEIPTDVSDGKIIPFSFKVFSPTDEFTPLQKDLQKIMETSTLKEELWSYLDKICQFKNRLKNGKATYSSREEMIKNSQLFEPADYDTILSVIQHLAKKAG